MNCPRCKTAIGPLATPDTIVTCPGCGSRLMTRSAAQRSQGGPKPAAVPAAPPAKAADMPPSATLPPTPAMLLGSVPAVTPPARPVGSDTERKRAARKTGSRPEEGPTLDTILREVRALRDTQDRMLEALAALRWSLPAVGTPGTAPTAASPFDDGPTLSPIRAQRRKTVLLVDDDPQTRDAAVAELQHAEVPVRACEDGRTALGAIAEEKPDVIVLEVGVGGEMGGKDVVNVIKATMEWVDIPIVLWTREAIANQKEAQQIHGADELVPKSGGAAALVARVISVFRR